jgi:predicted metalloprotease with PDZ domain
MGGIGLEHHQSSEDGGSPRYFLDWKEDGGNDLLPHEYTHSWDGKFRRPADLWTPNFNVAMRGSLLWVYEGQTQYWGNVLASRSGMYNHAKAMDGLALVAATYDHVVGRAWKNLEDTTNDPVVASRHPNPWRNWQRSEDYYSEGQLIWLDADTLIRQMSHGTKSLDDFAKAFYGIDDGSFVTHPYTFDDVVAALNAVQPYDWATFLNDRLYGHAKGAPLDGLARGGYRLVYSDKPNAILKLNEKRRHTSNFEFSLGFSVGKDDTLSNVLYDSPAFTAGLTIGAKLVAVNGEAYDMQTLKDAIKWAHDKKVPVELLVEWQKSFHTVTIPYFDGERYPHLEPVGAGERTIDQIYAAKP